MTKVVKTEYKGRCRGCGSTTRPSVHNIFDGIIDTIQCRDCYTIVALAEELNMKEFLIKSSYRLKDK